MNVSALVIDFAGVLLQVRSDVPAVEHLAPHHPIAVSGSSPDGYQVLDHFQLNTELLEYLRQFNTKWPAILVADDKFSDLPAIAPQLEGIFKRIITFEDLGYKNTDSEAYLAIAYRIGRSPQELLFVDAQPRNLEAAKSAGCVTHLYTGNTELVGLLNEATR